MAQWGQDWLTYTKKTGQQTHDHPRINDSPAPDAGRVRPGTGAHRQEFYVFVVASSAPNFDRIAPYYDGLAWVVFGRSLARAQTVFLDRVPARASVLVVGGGTGGLLEPLLSRSQPARIVYLEASARMLARASRRVLRRRLPGQVEFRLGDETALQPGERFEVVITPFVLDLFTAQTLRTRLLPRLRMALLPGGQWLVTDFVPGAGWGPNRLIQVMIWFFRRTANIEAGQLANWQPLFAQLGLRLCERQSQLNGWVSAEVWTAPNRQDRQSL